MTVAAKLVKRWRVKRRVVDPLLSSGQLAGKTGCPDDPLDEQVRPPGERNNTRQKLLGRHCGPVRDSVGTVDTRSQA